MRLVTLDIVVMILKNLVTAKDDDDVERVVLEDVHFAEIEGVREESTLLLRNFYKVSQTLQLSLPTTTTSIRRHSSSD